MGSKLKGNNTNGSMPLQADRDKRRREGNVGKEFQANDFGTFEMSQLKKYARVHKVKVKPRTNKRDLVGAVSRHFANQSVKEVDTIVCFLYTAHHRESIVRLPLQM